MSDNSQAKISSSYQYAFWLACLTVTAASLAPTEYLPQSLAFSWWDKAQHAIAFAVLGLSGLWAYPKRLRHVLVGLLALGIGIELAQAATEWRYGEVGDVLADGVGLALGGMAFRWVRPPTREPSPNDRSS